MSKLGMLVLAGLLAASAYPAAAAGTAAAAATPAAATAKPAAKPAMKPAMKPAAAKPVAAAMAPAGPAATGVVCVVTKSGKYVHVQAMNNGAASVPAGDSFAFVIVGPTKKTAETFVFKADLAAGASVDVTKAISAKAVASCTPSA